jgi:putative ABC transport system permease protein
MTSNSNVWQQFVWVLSTLLSHYRRHPGQTAFMAIGLMTGVALWAAVQLINDQARASYADADQLLGAQAGFWIRATPKEQQGETNASGVSVADYISLRRAGFDEIYPVIESRIATADGQLVTIIATDLLALPIDSLSGTTETNTPFSDDLFSGRQWLPLIQPEYEAWYPQSLASQLGVAEGDQLQLPGSKRLPPAVIQAREQQGLRIFMDVGAALSVLERSSFSYLAVTNLNPKRRQLLEQQLPDSLTLVENQQALDLSQLTASLHTQLTAMGLLSFAVGLFIVFNSVRFSLLTRQGTFTTLRELGVSTQILGSAIVVETLLWSLFGTVAGLGVGYLLSGWLLPTVAASLQTLFGAIVASEIGLSMTQVLTAWALTLGGLTLALAAPIWTRANMSVLASRSPSEWWRVDERARWQLAATAIVLMVGAALLFPMMDTVTDGFVVLALILFAGAFVLPMALHLAIFLALKVLPSSSWQARWAVSDAFSQLPQLRIALMALLLTLTANIGVSTLVDSFRTALSGWLEVRLSADLYVRSDSLDIDQLHASAINSDGAPSWLIDSHLRSGVSIRWQNRPTRVEGMDISAPDSQAILLAKQTANGFIEWQKGSNDSVQPILANEQVHYLARVELDDVITLDTPNGPMKFRVTGFFHDYGSPNFRFYLPNRIFKSEWPAASTDGIALWIRGNGFVAAEQALISSGAEPGDWVSQRDIKRISLAIFDRTFAITAALNSLTLLVAGIALLAALLAIHQQRLPEYAHWRSLGMHFSEWFRLVAIPLLILVTVTGLLALPLGWILSWMLIHELNVTAFGWTMPMLWSWPPVLQLAAVTSSVVLLALGVAALRVRATLPTAIKQLASNS